MLQDYGPLTFLVRVQTLDRKYTKAEMCVLDVCISVYAQGVTPGNTHNYTGNEHMGISSRERMGGVKIALSIQHVAGIHTLKFFFCLFHICT